MATQVRNRAMADGFMRACNEQRGAVCRILDLFSPTVALVGAPIGYNFKDRDPVHFWRHKSAHNAFIIPMMQSVLASVLRAMDTDEGE